MKEQEAKVLKTPLSKVPLLGDFFFKCKSIEDYKMNEIVNKLLLAEDKCMPEMHLKQTGFTYSACGPFAKNNERIQNFKKNKRFKIYLQN